MRYAYLFLTLLCILAQSAPLQARQVAHGWEEQRACELLENTLLFRDGSSGNADRKKEVRQLLIKLTPDTNNKRRVSRDEEYRIIKKLIYHRSNEFVRLDCNHNPGLEHKIRRKIVKQVEYVLRHSGYWHLSEHVAKKITSYIL